ncbi:acyl-CoA thioesterase [Candidatus Uabimicrobium amorphum]|uniref:4-hydroxybenzoyl-CoA thioesterase n=1 Tax=Uabimicrobium amorphum TaxID=2596890 RepID=A0A5S9IMW7_UABAM|nr:thioesterase family protein [Candidatus Uabimicrobium amorphum]BBM84838.1 4-hydroxybenzoyl-CoA thioesterase [Candidatus Uabimicrobium amorphum]
MNHRFHTTKRVEFSDTDMAGIVHFSNYFRYMEIAEHDFFRSLGLSVVMDHEGNTISWPRVKCSFEYKQPIRFEQIIDIYIDIEHIGKKSLKYVAYLKHNEQIMAIGHSTIVCCSYDKDGLKSIEIPQHFRECFSQ